MKFEGLLRLKFYLDTLLWKQVVFGMFHLGNSFLSIPGECVWEKGFEITVATLQWVLVALFMVLNEPWGALNFHPTL